MNNLRSLILESESPIKTIGAIVFGSNKKIGGIPSLISESPLNCSSDKRGFCEVCKECYAKSDYKRFEGHKKKVDTLILFFALLKKSRVIYRLFCDCLKYYKVEALRYNLEGDFKTVEDIKFLERVAIDNPQIKVYGYSKRRDLKKALEVALLLPNFYCGVNFRCKGANQFKVLDSIKEWYNTPLKCLGDCQTCKKCYTLKNKTIGCFIHGSPSKIQKRINNLSNWEFMSELIGDKLGFALSDTLPNGLFVRKICVILEGKGYKVPYKLTDRDNKSYEVKTVKDLINFIEGQ